jgi:hypothetical protein
MGRSSSAQLTSKAAQNGVTATATLAATCVDPYYTAGAQCEGNSLIVSVTTPTTVRMRGSYVLQGTSGAYSET